MDYSKLLNELKEASLFDLYRLTTAIDRELEDPHRIDNVRSQLQLGQKINYFDRKENRQIEAIIIELKKTRVLVEHVSDRTRWSIPFYWINITNEDTNIYYNNKKGLSKNELKVGDSVSFKDNQNREIIGVVQRLNQKSVTIIADNMKWRVAYSLLSPIIDINILKQKQYLQGKIIDI